MPPTTKTTTKVEGRVVAYFDYALANELKNWMECHKTGNVGRFLETIRKYILGHYARRDGYDYRSRLKDRFAQLDMD